MIKLTKTKVFFITIMFFLTSQNFVLSRTVRNFCSVIIDNFGTKTYYERYNGLLRPMLVKDKHENVLERYYYNGENIEKVSIRNLYSGEWIDIKIDYDKSEFSKTEGLYDYWFDIIIDGYEISEYVHRNYWISNKELDCIVLALAETSPKGVGLSFSNWFVKYINQRFGINLMRIYVTNNPGVITIAKKIISPEGLKYNFSSVPEEYQFLSDRELLISGGTFKINSVNVPDNVEYTDGVYVNNSGVDVELDSNEIMHTSWDSLDGISIHDIDIGNRWTVLLNGEIVGQVKNIGDSDNTINITGKPNKPIGMYIDKEGNIVQYQGKEIIKIISN